MGGAVDREVDSGVLEERPEEIVLEVVERDEVSANLPAHICPDAIDLPDRRYSRVVEDRLHCKRVVGIDQKRHEFVRPVIVLHIPDHSYLVG